MQTWGPSGAAEHRRDAFVTNLGPDTNRMGTNDMGFGPCSRPSQADGGEFTQLVVASPSRNRRVQVVDTPALHRLSIIRQYLSADKEYQCLNRATDSRPSCRYWHT